MKTKIPNTDLINSKNNEHIGKVKEEIPLAVDLLLEENRKAEIIGEIQHKSQKKEEEIRGFFMRFNDSFLW